MSQEIIEIGSIIPKITRPQSTPSTTANLKATSKPPSNTLILCELLLYMGTKPCEQDQEYFASKTKLYEILDYIQKQFCESYMNIQINKYSGNQGKINRNLISWI